MLVFSLYLSVESSSLQLLAFWLKQGPCIPVVERGLTPFSLTFEILPVNQDVGVVGRRSSPFCFLQNISSVKQVAVSHSAGQNSRRLDK